MNKIKIFIIVALVSVPLTMSLDYKPEEEKTAVSAAPMIAKEEVLTVETKEELPVFSKDDITIESNISVEELKSVLEGKKIFDLADAFIQAENKYGINSIFLTSLIAHESGWGESERSNNGSNNMSGYAVYANSSRGRYFSSKAESVLETARLLKEEYIDSSGQYNTGKKITDINSRYCIGSDGKPDYHWSKSITSIANDIVERIDG